MKKVNLTLTNINFLFKTLKHSWKNSKELCEQYFVLDNQSESSGPCSESDSDDEMRRPLGRRSNQCKRPKFYSIFLTWEFQKIQISQTL